MSIIPKILNDEYLTLKWRNEVNLLNHPYETIEFFFNFRKEK